MKSYGKYTQCPFGCCAPAPPSRFRGKRPLTKEQRRARKHAKTTERMQAKLAIAKEMDE